MQIFVDGSDGEREISGGDVVAAGEKVGLRWMAQSRLFRFGETVSFTKEEFIELCLTTLFFGKQLVTNLRDYGRVKGIVVDSLDENEVSTE